MTSICIDRIDHLVLTVADIEATVDFYERVLGFRGVTYGNGRRALAFGRQKLNLHPAAAPIPPHAVRPCPGAADFCFVARDTIEGVLAHLAVCGVPIIEGPVRRTGALGPMTTVYLRDPDANLVEIAVYD